MLGQLGMAFSWGMLLMYASWWAWHGSVFWGPRFLLVACMPASLALALHVSNSECRRTGVTLLTVSTIIWSVWVGVNGTIIRQGYADVCTANLSSYESLCWYVPEYSTLIYPFVIGKILNVWDRAYALISAIVAIVLIVPVLASRARNYALSRLLRSR